MAEIASSSGRVRDGEAALARGDWEEARAVFERELEVRETVEALEGLSWKRKRNRTGMPIEAL